MSVLGYKLMKGSKKGQAIACLERCTTCKVSTSIAFCDWQSWKCRFNSAEQIQCLTKQSKDGKGFDGTFRKARYQHNRLCDD